MIVVVSTEQQLNQAIPKIIILCFKTHTPYKPNSLLHESKSTHLFSNPKQVFEASYSIEQPALVLILLQIEDCHGPAACRRRRGLVAVKDVIGVYHLQVITVITPPQHAHCFAA
jgi:hypothetical protein